MVTIKISNLKKTFDKIIAVDDLTFSVNKEIFAFLGPNGAGKTTVLNLLLGLIKRDSGTISILGLDPAKNPNKIRRKVGLVPQETSLYEYLTAKENLEFHARLYGISRNKRKLIIKDALELSQLTDRADDLVSTYSGGMKRRLALVRSLMHDPEIIFLDEPTLGVDVQNRNEIWERIKNLKETKTILLSTNYMDEAERLSDRCAIIDKGKLITIDSSENLKKLHAGGTKLSLIISSESDAEMLFSELKKITPDIKHTIEEEGNNKFLIPAKEHPNTLLTKVTQSMQQIKDIDLLDFRISSPTLDDVFLSLTGKALRD
ncbi:MAG: ABC transporter ATP-binding protein [Candidatus Hodarchaeales archaeon]|jgi:ABC-2 type transport system ATP-binding protein